MFESNRIDWLILSSFKKIPGKQNNLQTHTHTPKAEVFSSFNVSFLFPKIFLSLSVLSLDWTQWNRQQPTHLMSLNFQSPSSPESPDSKSHFAYIHSSRTCASHKQINFTLQHFLDTLSDTFHWKCMAVCKDMQLSCNTTLELGHCSQTQ